jgi:hypothetical protein
MAPAQMAHGSVLENSVAVDNSRSSAVGMERLVEP